MRKALSLFKASLSEGMSFFKISGRNRSKFMKMGLPIIIGVLFMSAMASYGYMIMEQLSGTGMEFVTLTLFSVITTLFIVMEGVYKTSGLLFNCRDDDIVLSLPIKKSTVLLIRMMKFYLFEVMVNALFLAPVMLVYGVNMDMGILYYVVSLLALLLLPIVPVVVSCIVGGLISYFSVKFKFKNLAEIVLTTIALIVVLIASFSLQDILQSITQNAGSINERIASVYYPIGGYIGLVSEFSIGKLVMFILVNVGILLLTVLLLGRVYFKINSRVKVVKSEVKNKKYKINTRKPIFALIKKELNRFVSSSVFVVNAGFGLVLYLLACIFLCVNTDGMMVGVAENGVEWLTADKIMSFMPALMFGLIFFTSMMTSITSSMISLEGKSFNVLKSLPVSAMTIIVGKVLAAMVVIVPIILVGDLMMFIKFDFSIWQILMILIASVVTPLVAELFGIIVNLKYPKMDAEDDVEVVKQSMSSMIAVFTGMGVSVVMIAIIGFAFMSGVGATETIGAGLLFSVGMAVLALFYLNAKGVEEFNGINV
ncbi:hypothetical protein IJH24_00050 [Candidatus Saccharibacteria bacterium]|nr:hypothetical protein [Candidatus Saccharibacteria bacterium]